MQGLTATELVRACRIFREIAYPAGGELIPARPAAFLALVEVQPLETALAQTIVQAIVLDGNKRGYAIRLGSARYPHVKLQVINCDQTNTWVYGVDTHDGLRLDPLHDDYSRWSRIQLGNRELKQLIERAWETEGLLTFNALLRRGLECHAPHPNLASTDLRSS